MVSTPDVNVQWWAAGERAWSNDRLRAGTWTRGLKGLVAWSEKKKSNVTGTMAGDDRWEHMQATRSGGANGRRQWGRVDWAPATATATLRYPVVICQPSERSVAFPQREEPRGQQQQQQAWRQPCLKRRCGNYLSMLSRAVGWLADGSRQRKTAPSVCMLPNR
jgi:hypothetical protein